MSASLVGSEMCIRDRCMHVRHGVHVVRNTTSRGRPPAKPGSGHQECCNACLLYTSDAADDM
eukprot:11673680-Alexandrium_andersonii.AAC.1